MNEPIASLAREQGMIVLVDLVPDQIPWLFSGLVVQRASLEGRRDMLKASSRPRSRVTTWRCPTPARAKEVLARETRITDPKIIEIGYNDFQAQAPHNTELSIEGARNILALFPASGSQNLADYMDRRHHRGFAEGRHPGGARTEIRQAVTETTNEPHTSAGVGWH